MSGPAADAALRTVTDEDAVEVASSRGGRSALVATSDQHPTAHDRVSVPDAAVRLLTALVH